MEYNRETSWNRQIKSDIDRHISLSSDFEDFIFKMKEAGYQIKRGKYTSYRPPGKERFARGKTLGIGFTDDSIKAKIAMSKLGAKHLFTREGEKILAKTRTKTNSVKIIKSDTFEKTYNQRITCSTMNVSTPPAQTKKLFLNVPFEEKDKAKVLGARWDPDCKKWYITDRNKYHLFRKWVNDSIIVLDHFYILEGEKACFRCGKEIPVIGFALENYLYFLDCEQDVFPDYEWHIGEINIASFIYSLPEKLLAYLKERYNYYYSYSKFAEGSYYANHCRFCNVLQGNFYLFEEVDSPFFIEDAEVAKKLKLHKILLSNDIAINADMGWGSNDYLIKNYAKVDTFGNFGDYL